jgi:hypothetical protein
MNAETTELKAVEQTTKTEEGADILALSFDDLDLVAGGTAVGGLH